jgi:ubiquitin carboxyl-terminal hydrolase 14
METDDAAKGDADVSMEGGDEDLKAALAMSMATEEAGDDENIVIGPGLPKDFQGQYELFAIVTHKGRDADGGHYMVSFSELFAQVLLGANLC